MLSSAFSFISAEPLEGPTFPMSASTGGRATKAHAVVSEMKIFVIRLEGV